MNISLLRCEIGESCSFSGLSFEMNYDNLFLQSSAFCLSLQMPCSIHGKFLAHATEKPILHQWKKPIFCCFFASLKTGNLHFANIELGDSLNDGKSYICIVENTVLRSLVQGDDQEITPRRPSGIRCSQHCFQFKFIFFAFFSV